MYETTNQEESEVDGASCGVNEQGNAWYTEMFSTIFGAATYEEERNCNDTGGNSQGNDDENREDVDNESVDVESLSTLARGFGDDLNSLPFIQGEALPREEDLVLSLDLEREGRFSSPLSLVQASLSNDSVESVVEQKINNLKAGRSTQDSEKFIPYLLRKMFPTTLGRGTDQESKQNKQDPTQESRRQALVHELQKAVDLYGPFDVRCANIRATLGDLHAESHEFNQALRLHNDAVLVYTTKLGDNHHATLKAKIRLGQVQENAGKYDDAITTFHNVMSMTRALQRDKDPSDADVMTKIASTLRKQGKYELSIKTLKGALKRYREALGDSHPSVSTTVDAIASLYVTKGDFTKASTILEEVVKLKAATFGMTSKEVASSLSELATCYECAEMYSKAMDNLKKAYKIYAGISGGSGERAILSLERIALIYQATGQFKKAAIAYLGVLRGRKRALGESHPTVGDTYFHLGVSLRESGQQDKAFKCMKQALNIYVGEGKDMHDVEMIAEVMHELAIIHKMKKEMDDAIKTFKQEISIRRKLGQPEYPLIAQTLNHLGVAEFELKNHNRALTYFMEALTIYEKQGNGLGTDFAEVLYNAGLVFESIRNKQKARDAFLEAARIFKENGYAEDHPHLSKAVNKLRRM